MAAANHLGELAALGVSLVWTVSALSFEQASRRMGSVLVNWFKIIIAFCLLSTFSIFYLHSLLPSKATLEQWFWLSLSGVIGFVVCDLFLFKSYLIIGARLAMLTMTLTPAFASLIGWIWLNETLDIRQFAGIAITTTGISLAVYARQSTENIKAQRIAYKGFVYAAIAALTQAFANIFTKKGVGSINPVHASQIRLIAAIVGFTALVAITKKYVTAKSGLTDPKAMQHLLSGSFFGPFVGVTLGIFALQHTNTGVATLLMALTPIFIIAPSVFIYKQKITVLEVIGAAVSMLGVSMFFM